MSTNDSKRPKLSVLVVDDSRVARRLVSEVLLEAPEVGKCVEAGDGRAALDLCARSHFDVIVLDLTMPELDGLQTLEMLKLNRAHPPVVVFSASAERGAHATIQALLAGASDYVTKPVTNDVEAARQQMRRELVPCVVSLGLDSTAASHGIRGRRSERRERSRNSGAVDRMGELRNFDIVAIGASTGGPNALVQFLAALPKPLSVPIVVVQHLPSSFTPAFVANLSQHTGLNVHEAYAGACLDAADVWLAPGGRHLLVRQEENAYELSLSDQAPENACRPAVDVLFRSIAACYGERAVGVMLTGMGLDGLNGSQILVRSGGTVLAQDHGSSVVWGMPGAVVDAGLAAFTGDPTELAAWLGPCINNKSQTIPQPS